MQAVILAAGQGKRLHPITISRTKAMAPIVGKPIIERVMDTLILSGIRDFTLVTSPEDYEIQHYFTAVSSIDAEVKMVIQPEPLGMGHALLQAVPQIRGDFILSACDNLVGESDIRRMLETWKNEKPNAVLSTLKVNPPDIVRMGIVELNGNLITRIVEKPSLEEAPSNIGSVPLYIFNQDFIKYLSQIHRSPRGEFELQDAIQALIENDGLVRAVEINHRTDLTKPEDLLALNIKILSNGYFNSSTASQKCGIGTTFIQPIQIDPNVTIGSQCVIGPNVYIEQGSTIGDGTHLEDVVVLRNRIVPDGEVIRNKVVW